MEVGCRQHIRARKALIEVSFEIQPGRVLGVLGRTGSGKSTLTRLLFRLYDPDRGSVWLGGVNLRELRWMTCASGSPWSPRMCSYSKPLCAIT